MLPCTLYDNIDTTYKYLTMHLKCVNCQLSFVYLNIF